MWQLAELATHPEIQEKARIEALEKLPPHFTYDDLKEPLPYIDGFIKEILRIHPPVAILATRETTKEVIVNNIKIPAGFIVITELSSMGFNTKIWGDPEALRPERWFPENVTKAQRNAWMPFIMGPRVCIGMNMSLLEQRLFVVTLLRRFSQINLDPKGEIKDKPTGLTSTPDVDKLIITFKK